MDDKQRTKVLALVLAGTVGVFALRSSAESLVMKPVRDLQAKVASASRKNESLSKQKFELNTARAKMEAWTAISLPKDPDIAQRLYREWVTELTRYCGFAGSTFDVVPGGRSSQKGLAAVGIEVKNAEASLEELSKFLYMLEQADLMQRIASLRMDSTGAKGNPDLKFTMVLEGLILDKADARSELFPRTQVAAALTTAATDLAVQSKAGFPEEYPFVVKIGREGQQEYLLAESATETGWKVKRGHLNSKTAAHSENATVELFPVNWDRRETSLDNYSNFIKTSMFVIPSPPKTFNPRLAGVSDQDSLPGQKVSFTARAEGFDTESGEPVFALKDAVEGMAIDPKTGVFTWEPSAEVSSGQYSGTVVLTQTEDPAVNLETKFTVTLKAPNTPPALTIPSTGIVILDRPFSLKATATDAEGTEGLKFSLGQGSPEGLTIDPNTGLLTWTPPRTFTPGKYDVEVKVTDTGDDPKTDSKKVTLDVQDDNAAMTVLAAVLGKDGVLHAWFRNKGKGTSVATVKLKEGDLLTLSEIQAEIVKITTRTVTLKDTEGVWKLELGQSVRERKLIEPAPKPVVEESATKTETPETVPPTDNPAPAEGPGDATEPKVETSDPASATPVVTPTPGDAPTTEPPAASTSDQPADVPAASSLQPPAEGSPTGPKAV